ncbi:MAG: prephenate dehydrogenase/arogenate dehydrogenase family protein [Leptospiraceae bacterium]|nr:prephenate dehydrogenase/arogenate dehydrogenase family protein [Leptospiraceae bacterium]MCP5510514.1 prephenate dehydrogenase/arogenate dehydrogenase family protein [Leptospiraceae bacterium]
MGGSLSLALKKYNKEIKVTGVVRSKSSFEEARSLQIVDSILMEEEILDDKDICHSFDLIVFGLPVDLTCEKILSIPDTYRGYMTDLGSTKKEIIQTVNKKFSSTHNYFSSHPMTGSELSGAKNSLAGLYENKLCILTPAEHSSESSRIKIQEFWKVLGSHTIEISETDHDEILAYLSHSPHIISSLMVNWVTENPLVLDYNDQSPIPLYGGGFRDMSRIAGSNPEMWEAIIRTNHNSVKKSLIHFQNKLNELILLLEKEEKMGDQKFWGEYFKKSKISRNKILKISSEEK